MRGMKIAAALTVLVVLAGCSHKKSFPAAGRLSIKTSAGAHALAMADLAKLPHHEASIDGAAYTGVRLRDIIGPIAPTASFEARGADGYRQTLSAETVLRDDCLVAFEKGGKPLAAKEGPLRLVVPGSPGLSIHGLVAVELAP